VAVVQSGDVVHFDLLMTGERQVEETSRAVEVVWDFDTIYNLDGPAFVDGAEPGDMLEVELLSLTPARRAGRRSSSGSVYWWTTSPIPTPRSSTSARAGSDARSSSRDTPRAVPRHDGNPPGRQHSPLPPTRAAATSTTAISPKARFCGFRSGAKRLSSPPAMRAAQGDVEVCVTGIECPMQASLRLTVRRQTIPGPIFKPGKVRTWTAGGYATMGLNADLMEGRRSPSGTGSPSSSSRGSRTDVHRRQLGASLG
jgi:hypothetical protein